MNKTGFCKIWNLFVISIILVLNTLTAEAQTQSTRLSIHLDKVPMERIVNEIEQQTRYLFLFNKDIDSKQITVSVNATDKTVPEILPLLFDGTGLDYTVEGMNILVTKTDSAAKNIPNSGKISGTVTDPSGHPVVGASVLVKGTTVGATTDVDGRFALTVPPPQPQSNWKLAFWVTTLWSCLSGIVQISILRCMNRRLKLMKSLLRLSALSAIRRRWPIR